jgi:hypothetical protein
VCVCVCVCVLSPRDRLLLAKVEHARTALVLEVKVKVPLTLFPVQTLTNLCAAAQRADTFPTMQIESSTATVVCFSLVDRNTFINACIKVDLLAHMLSCVLVLF